MLRDDMSKSDTVAKGRFRWMSENILQEICTGYVRDKASGDVAVCKVWLRFAVQVQWDLQKRFQGVEGLRQFCLLDLNIHPANYRPNRLAEFKQYLAPWLARETRVPIPELAAYATAVRLFVCCSGAPTCCLTCIFCGVRGPLHDMLAVASMMRRCVTHYDRF